MSELISLLKRSGLNHYESKAYSSLLKLNSGTASIISKNSGIPRARVYDVLMGLEKKGFVVVSPSRPLSFRALEPEQALNNLKQSKKKEFERSLEELERIKKLLSRKAVEEGQKKAEEINEGVWLVKGRQNIYSLLEEMIKKCRKEIVFSSTNENIERKINAFERKLVNAKQKGVKVHFWVFSPLSNKIKEKIRWAKVKELRDNGRFVLCDREKVLLFLEKNAGEEKDRALLIESPFIANYFLKARV